MTQQYTSTQGQYLAFIYHYKKLNKVAPSHMDFRKYFRSDPASVNQMLKTLERKGLSNGKKVKPEALNCL